MLPWANGPCQLISSEGITRESSVFIATLEVLAHVTSNKDIVAAGTLFGDSYLWSSLGYMLSTPDLLPTKVGSHYSTHTKIAQASQTVRGLTCAIDISTMPCMLLQRPRPLDELARDMVG